MTWNQRGVLEDRAKRAGEQQRIVNGVSENMHTLAWMRNFAAVLFIVVLGVREFYTGDIQNLLDELSHKHI